MAGPGKGPHMPVLACIGPGCQAVAGDMVVAHICAPLCSQPGCDMVAVWLPPGIPGPIPA